MSDTGNKTVELSAEELRLIKANLAFAIENCPVEGGIVTEDGRFASGELVTTLLEKLKGFRRKD